MPEVEEIVLSLQGRQEERADLIVHLNSHTNQPLCHVTFSDGGNGGRGGGGGEVG